MSPMPRNPSSRRRCPICGRRKNWHRPTCGSCSSYQRPRIPVEQRFWEKVSPEPTSGCWLWTGAVDLGGYGIHWVGDGKSHRAHRFAFERLRGPIPEGMTLDHLCEVKSCVNPTHLDPCSAAENRDRYWQRRVTGGSR